MGFDYVDLPLPGRLKVVDLTEARQWEISRAGQDLVYRYSVGTFFFKRVIRSRDGRYFRAGPTPYKIHKGSREYRAEMTPEKALETLAWHGLATDLPPDLEALARGEVPSPAPAADPEPEAPTVGTGPDTTAHEAPLPAPGIDYGAIIARAGRERKRLVKNLVALMRDRESADFDTIKDNVHGSDVEDGTVRKMVSEANAYIGSIGQGRLKFRTDGAVVYRSVSPL